jgi:protein-S-isoprenylcysteine O-methyltransferase Ste14
VSSIGVNGVAVPARAWARWRVRLGYPLGAICLWLSHPNAKSIAIGGAIACAGLVVRASAAGHLRKSEALACTGPYAHTRNPLYLGSALLTAGFAAASASWIAAVLLGVYFFVFYRLVMRREEAELHAQYGAAFEDYAKSVPLFWPRISSGNAAVRMPGGTGTERPGANQAGFSFAQYRRNREYRAAIGTILLLLVMAALAHWRG